MICSKLLLILIFLTLIGCNGGSERTVNPSVPDPVPPHDTGEDNTDLNPTSPQVTYASKWTSVTLLANSAKTIIDSLGHFSTNRNACGKDAYGSIALEVWNPLAKNLNLAIEKDPPYNDYCIPIPETNNKYMDGTVEIKMEQGNRKLYELRDNQICSTIADPQVSDILFGIINKLIIIADKEDCPNGWGSFE